jgi:hypothetical protein
MRHGEQVGIPRATNPCVTFICLLTAPLLLFLLSALLSRFIVPSKCIAVTFYFACVAVNIDSIRIFSATYTSILPKWFCGYSANQQKT